MFNLAASTFCQHTSLSECARIPRHDPHPFSRFFGGTSVSFTLSLHSTQLKTFPPLPAFLFNSSVFFPAGFAQIGLLVSRSLSYFSELSFRLPFPSCPFPCVLTKSYHSDSRTGLGITGKICLVPCSPLFSFSPF